MIESDVGVLVILLAVLAALFGVARTRVGTSIFAVVPLLVFAYFVPTALSNTGVIPTQAPVYDFIKNFLLPASLVLLTLTVDVPALLRLGRPALLLFLSATASIVFGGPLAYWLLQDLVPPEMREEAWRGLAALAGSWIGGGANFTAIGESVGASDATLGMMVVVDTAVANVWMAVLLWIAQRDRAIDAKIGADRSQLEAVRERVADFQAEIARPTTLADLLAIGTIGLGVAYVSQELSALLPPVGDIITGFTWTVILATSAGVALSFTRARRLEGAGASAVGSVFLYLLVASIGAKADFAAVFSAPGILAVGALWMVFHAAIVLAVWRLARVPIFFAAVGSQANVGGAASAPIVASAFHPALAPVGVVLAVFGYVLGTYAALLAAYLLSLV